MGLKSIIKQVTVKLNFNLKRTLNGRQFIIPVIRNMGFANRSMETGGLIRLFKKLELPKDGIFIDVGVNVGQTLLSFRSCYDNPYWGFEPNPSCVFYLHTLIKNNGFKNTMIIPVGLSSQSELAKFYIKNETDSAGTIVEDLRPDYYQSEDVNYVPLFRFDSLKLNSHKISLIKIDVEGAELEVLSGMTETLKAHKPLVICEVLDYHSEKSKANSQERADKLVALMKQAGYRAYRIVPNETDIQLQALDNIILKKWAEESWNLNDYLFVTADEEPSLVKKFGSIVKS
jgi:FkbM family methyltransferase